jgi:hypothetical protein
MQTAQKNLGNSLHVRQLALERANLEAAWLAAAKVASEHASVCAGR